MATRRSNPKPAAPAPISFVLHGAIAAEVAATRGASAPRLPAGLPRGQLRHSLRLVALRGGDVATAEHHVQALPGRDVVLLHLAGGPTLVLHPENARDLLLAQQAQAPRSRSATGAAPGEVSVPARLGWPGLESAGAAPGSGTRGLLGEALLSGFEIVSGVASEELAEAAAERLGDRVDAQVEPGLYALDAAGLPRLKGSGKAPLKAATASAEPLLVFVHGTFSNTAGAFGKLWAQHPQRVAALFAHYGGRVYGLEHATLRVSPLANALALARAMPRGARLHLVTHSRGGLVAELLARVAANPTLHGEALDNFTPADRRDLAVLGADIARKGLLIERVVRVACPARGTLLASQRLDAYLSVFRWTLELAGVPVLPELVDFLAEVAQHRSDPATLPGLAAQVPGSALIQWLHAAREPLPGELRVIAGDVQGDSVGSWLKTLVADSFYWTDNDFVVQTRSMYGGAPRAGGARYLLDRGGNVGHSDYFGNERTAAATCSALLDDQPEGFATIGPLSWAGASASGVRGPASADARPAADKPAVILLPGIVGSHLAADGQRIWLGPRLVGGLRRLAWPDAPGTVVQPDGLIGPIYDALATHLADSHEVIEFDFDWRRPIEDEAGRLATVAEAALAARARSQQAVRFVAHSMGGLVVRTMALQSPALWRRLMDCLGARVLMLGTPNGGSWAPMQVLSGDDSFGNTLVAMGAPLQDHAARQWMAQMPGFIQLQAGLLDGRRHLDQATTWQALADADLAAVNDHNWWHSGEAQLNVYRWGVPTQDVLDAAKRLRLALDAQREHDLPGYADKLLLVVGHARFTPEDFEIGPRGLEYLDPSQTGDGRVSLVSALLPGVRTWQVDCEHGGLPAFAKAFAAYVELLSNGHSRDPVLQTLPPVTAAASLPLRSRPARQPQVPHPPERQADIGLLASAAPGEGHAAGSVPALAVSVINGNLMFSRQPLLIGHYHSGQLTGTEWVVNSLVGGGMLAALRAGLYPDEPGTHQMFRNAGHGGNPLQLPRPPWAIVVGLGDESAMKPVTLMQTVRKAIIGWAQRLAEEPGGAPPTFELASTLIGSGGTGITPGQSAQLLAQAGREANQSLAASGWPLLARLRLVELYLDRASEAWRGLQVQAATSPRDWRIDAVVKAGTGALRRPLDAGYRGAEYDLISATTQESRAGESTIAYVLDTKRARTELRTQATQAALVRELVARASTEHNQDAQIGHSLFQLLVPVELDPFLGGTTEMRIKLDRGTAGIPWELLQDHRAGGADQRPWAVRTKLLRSLITAQFRQTVRDADGHDGVLIIGEPATPAGAGYPRLPGARRETQAVAAAFGWQEGRSAEVKALIAGADEASAPDAEQIVNALLERDWQVVHIAGHGAAPERLAGQAGDGAPRGVVLSHGFLGASEIHAMRTVPELVFVNCCHLAERNLGQLLGGEANPAQFASTAAEALISIGVRCVIAAGWAVQDEAAEVFATSFYAALLRGRRFLDAAAEAREKAWQAQRENNTWAAYQCYGDPDWTLRREDGVGAPSVTAAERFAGVSSPLALALALETVAVESRFLRADDEAERERSRQGQRQRLAYLEGRFAALWGAMGAVAEAFALAWSELGELPNAIAWYRRAVAAEDASASQRAVEQLNNLITRQALAEVRSAADAQRARPSAKGERDLAAARSGARRSIHAALAGLVHLQAQQRTMERESLVGSAWRRLAMLEGDAGREAAAQRAIAQMRSHCAAAQALAAEAGSVMLFYPALNRLAAELAGAGPRWRGLDRETVAATRRSLLDKARDDPNFWSVVGLTDLRLYEAVADGALAQQAAALVVEYADLHQHISAPRDWRSVHDRIAFVLQRYRRRTRNAAERQACATVLHLLARFAWPPPVRPEPR